MSFGGAERHVVDVAIRQSRAGDDVAIACSADGPIAAEATAAGVPVHVLGGSLVKRRLDLRYARALRKLVGRLGPEIVHAHLYASIVAAGVAVGGRVPLVVTEQTEAPWRGRRARLASRAAYARAAAVIAVSERIRAGIVEDFGVPAAKVTRIANAVAPPGPMAGEVSPPWKGRPSVGVCARLVPEKGLDVFVDAAVRLLAAFPDAAFPVIGDGPLREALEGRVSALGLADRVIFLGFRADCRALLTHLDVLVVPSRSEGTPLTIVEAMHAGVPVVATTVGGIPEQVRDGETGLLVQPEDAEALAAAVQRVAGDAAFAGRLAGNARRHARTEFDPAAMVRRIDAVYASALATGTPARRAAPVAIPELAGLAPADGGPGR